MIALFYKLNTIFDFLIEKILNIKVNEIVKIEQFAVPESVKEKASLYQGVWLTNFLYLLLNSNSVKKKSVFVDLGSGKGKVCFLASFFGFKKIIGIEVEPNLVAIANQNFQRSRFLKKSNVSFEEADASKYKLPMEKNLVVFLFNPFRAEILESFLSENLERLPSGVKLEILYSNDKESRTLEAYGFKRSWKNEIFKLSIWEFKK